MIIQRNFFIDKRIYLIYNIQAMKVDLRKIVDLPGGEIPFGFDLSCDGLDFPSVVEYRSNPIAEGRIYNEAGVLHLEASVTADMLCICDRCGAEFESTKVTDCQLILVEEDPDDNPELFVVEGCEADLDEILSTCFILSMETKFLCREDCKGLCSKCGRNLNDGPCNCKKEIDPRFAVLSQLLDN